ncbi:hypothetical protein FRC02_000954 [Tulasnella sp. 418]|nr:hypothetical protein FRC02_000954 [Tulasnella sp. 418]
MVILRKETGLTSSDSQTTPVLYSSSPPAYRESWRRDWDKNKSEDLKNLETADIQHHESWKYETNGDGLSSVAEITNDGRINMKLNLKKDLPPLPTINSSDFTVKEFAIDEFAPSKTPPLDIVIMIVGSRGDVQPFLALGRALQQHGHRVRLATHETFRGFVKATDLEFYPIGGDPAELMSYMVKNPGLMPGFASLTNGDISKKRKMLAEILEGCWKACYKPDGETGQRFIADAIISNPPAFAHVHCAEALGIPLHLSFTMPWCATSAFPHPLVNVNTSNTEPSLANSLSYALAELMQWQGLGDVINRFRRKTLGLDILSHGAGPSIIDHLKIPWTYCFSPSLIPKPADWLNHIDVVGFYFLEKPLNYNPPRDLVDFLEAGDPPIYIGFGSIVVEDPEEMTEIIFRAIKLAGVRAIVSAGWGGLGLKDNVPSYIYMLPGHPGVPHDWLFTKVSAVCHHGGAGTTAIGLYMGKPTVIVPFFGDQPFWGQMVFKAGAGPKPIEPRKLSSRTLADGISYCLTGEAKLAAEAMGLKIRSEDGARSGLESFHKHLPLLNMRCDLFPEKVAVWWSPQHLLKLSAFAAQVLVNAGHLQFEKLERHRPMEYDTHIEATDPISGGVMAMFWTITECTAGVTQMLTKPAEGMINAVTALPRGSTKLVVAVQEGFHNASKALGSDVRQPGEIRGWKSGVREAGRAFGHGIYDGFSNLVVDPHKGAKKEGYVGAIKGSARSLINVHLQPVAGALALLTHSGQGIWKSIKKRQTNAREQYMGLYDIRMQQGIEEFHRSNDVETQRVLKCFEESKQNYAIRRKRLKHEWEMFGGGVSDGRIDPPDPASPGYPEPSLHQLDYPPPPVKKAHHQSAESLDPDTEFHVDLTLSIQNSLKDDSAQEPFM